MIEYWISVIDKTTVFGEIWICRVILENLLYQLIQLDVDANVLVLLLSWIICVGGCADIFKGVEAIVHALVDGLVDWYVLVTMYHIILPLHS